MTDYFVLSDYIWVRSWTTEPTLYYYADTDKTITIGLYDVYGKQVTDGAGTPISMTYNAVQGVNSIDLGDWLYANRTYIPEGIYILAVNNGANTYYTTILVADTASSIPVSPDEEQYIRKILVMDKVTLITRELNPKTTVVPYSNRFITFIYLHNTYKKKGRIIIYDPSEQQDTGWVRYATIKTVYQFNSLNDLVNWLLNHTYIKNYDDEVLKDIVNVLDKYPEKLANILSLYAINPIVDDIKILDWKVTVDTVNNIYRVEAKYFTRLGIGWDDVWKWLAYAGGCAVAGAIAGSAIPGIGTATGALIGFAVGTVAFFVDSALNNPSNTDDLKNSVKQTGDQGKQHVTNQYNKALSDLNTLRNAGEISDHAYQVLKADIDELYKVSITAIDEVVEESYKAIDDAYKRGYKAGVADSQKWIFGAGVGGFALGLLVKR